MDIIDYLSIGFLILFGIALILVICNKWLPEWACNKLSWHLAPKLKDFDGASINGKCPRCNKFVMQDSQGNWF